MYSTVSSRSNQQQTILDIVSKGHNLYCGGIAGCGGTFVASRILQDLSRKEISFACTCTTGIACTLYKNCPARTIHSFAEIGQCRGTNEKLLRNVMANSECVKRCRETNVLFIDEISMLSQRTLEVFTYVAHNVRSSDYAFGGLQVVAFGDFLQLPPVPNALHNGNHAFESALWNLAFPHQILLEESFQAKKEKEFVNILRDISKWHYSVQSAEIIQGLSRPIDPSD